MKYLKSFNEAKVVIKNKVAPKYKNKYVARIEFMYGDADGEAFDEYDFDNEDEFTKVALFCKKCIATYSNSGRGEESYDIVPGWDEMKNILSPHYNPERYGEGEASWEGVEFFYYDENGQKNEVEVIFTPEEQAEIDAQSEVSWEDYRQIKALQKAQQKIDDKINKIIK